MQTIPRIVYQTWFTKTLPPQIVCVRDFMIALNPGWQFVLYDDTDIEAFIATHSVDQDDNDELLQCWHDLAIGAAKADLWRYLILYKRGGIYLDIDAVLLRPIDELFLTVNALEDAISPQQRIVVSGLITREQNAGVFNNWILCFAAGHPLMRRCVEHCFRHIRARSTNNILALTGPLALTAMLHWSADDVADIAAVEDVASAADNVYGMPDGFVAVDDAIVCVYGRDMGDFARCKHRFHDVLYSGVTGAPHWREAVAANGGRVFRGATLP